jgi:hypothetical protein
VCEAFQSLPLLRVTHEDDMVPFIPTADPLSGVFGFYRHFGDHLVLKKDAPRGDDAHGDWAAGGSVLLAIAKLKFRALLDSSLLFSAIGIDGSNERVPSVSDEGATEEEVFRVVEQSIRADYKRVDQRAGAEFAEGAPIENDEESPAEKRDGAFEGISVKVLLNETLWYGAPGDGRWVLEVQDGDDDGLAGTEVHWGKVQNPTRRDGRAPTVGRAAAAAAVAPPPTLSDGGASCGEGAPTAARLAAPWPWRWRAPGSRRHVGWLQYLLEAFMDRNSYWLHLLHSNPLAHSIA